MKSSKTIRLIGIALISIALVSCAGPNPISDSAPDLASPEMVERLANPAGFWRGLWHGMTAVFAFIGRLFGMNIGVYEVVNSGGWYNFGFLLGVGAFTGGASSSSR